MFNHVRTLLLNMSYIGDGNEHIPSAFRSLPLPSKLAPIYSILFPDNTSRYFKLFLVQNYLQLIEASGLHADLITYDSRVTYTLTDEFFKINRYSNPIISNLNYPIFVSGDYNKVNNNQYFYDNFFISQVGNTNQITIYSKINNVYLKDSGEFEDSNLAKITLNFTNDTSAIVPVGTSGITFAISGGNSFTNTSNKTWEFIVEAPYQFDFKTILGKIRATNADKTIFAYRTDIDVDKYLQLWLKYPNDVHKFAALLLAYTAKVNTLL